MAAKLRHIRKRLSQFLNCFEFSATAADLGKLFHSTAITDRQIDLDRQTDRQTDLDRQPLFKHDIDGNKSCATYGV